MSSQDYQYDEGGGDEFPPYKEDFFQRIIQVNWAAKGNFAIGGPAYGVSPDGLLHVKAIKTGATQSKTGAGSNWTDATIAPARTPAGGSGSDVQPGGYIYNIINCMIGGQTKADLSKTTSSGSATTKGTLIAGGFWLNFISFSIDTGSVQQAGATIHYSKDGGKTWSMASVPSELTPDVGQAINGPAQKYATILYLAYDPATQIFYADGYRGDFLTTTGETPTSSFQITRLLLSSTDGVSWSTTGSTSGGDSNFGPWMGPFLEKIPSIPGNGFTEVIDAKGNKLSYQNPQILASNAGGVFGPIPPFTFNGQPVGVPYGSKLSMGWQAMAGGIAGGAGGPAGVESVFSPDTSCNIGYSGGKYFISGSLMRRADEDPYDWDNPETANQILVYTSTDGKAWKKELETRDIINVFTGSCGGSPGGGAILPAKKAK